MRDYLGPALHRHGLQDIKLMIWDHNRDRMFERAAAVYGDPAAAKYVWGTAFHWYAGDNFDNVGRTAEAFPDKPLLFSEGCQEGGPHIGSWAVGERYGQSIISDLRQGAVGWIDWNVVLDITGGPNHVGNLCSAPIICDTEKNEVLLQSSYFYIGHFSRFIRPGARRIACAPGRDDLETVAFVNTDGSIAAVIMNRNEEPRAFMLKFRGSKTALRIPHRSIMTLEIKE